MKKTLIEIENVSVEISKPDKELFPSIHFTKRDMAEYYLRMADIMLPHMRGRPVSMKRFPDGIHKEGFFQKTVPDYFPPWIERVTLPKKEAGAITHLVCNRPATLVYLADQACVTPHVWLSTTDRIEYPDRLVFDLDPPNDDFEPVRQGARHIARLAREVGLVPYLMTTGSRGLHVVLPLDRISGFDDVRTFAKSMAEVLAMRHQDLLTTEQRKDKRRGRVFLDYLRNAYAQTVPPPYSIRARPSASVATPIEWHELADAKLRSTTYHVKNIFRRLGRKADPWKDMNQSARSLKKAKSALREAVSERGTTT